MCCLLNCLISAMSGLPRGITGPHETDSEHWEPNLCFANLTGDAKESHVGRTWLNLCTKLSLWKFLELTRFFFSATALSVSSFFGFATTNISYYPCDAVILPGLVHYLPHYLLCTTLSVCLNHPIHKMGLIILALVYLEQILLGKWEYKLNCLLLFRRKLP